MGDDREQTKVRMDAYRVAEDRFLCDINNLIDEYGESTSVNLDSTLEESEQMLLAWKPIFEHFLYECLYYYEQTDENRVGILFALQSDMVHIFSSMAEGATLLDELCQKINLYFRRFKSESYIDCGNEYIQEILESPKNNCYKKRLIGMIMHAFFNDDDYIKRKIESLSVNYYFDEVMPREDTALAESRYKIKNDIPVFSDVNIGQVWMGRNRMANFIRALHLSPKPAGKNSRKAQEKSIAQSCMFTDDKAAQVLTLNEIYEQRRERIRKERVGKYEPYLKTLLFTIFQSTDIHTIQLTKIGLLKEMQVIPLSYKKLMLNYYSKELSLKTDAIKLFREIANERFSDILYPVLEKMAVAKQIDYKKYRVVVVQENERTWHIPENEPERLGMEGLELTKLLTEAENKAITMINDGKSYLKCLSDVIIHRKLYDYQKAYDKIISENYGWNYVYTRLELTKINELPYVTVEEQEKARQEMNRLIVEAISSTLNGYIERHKEETTSIETLSAAIDGFIEYEIAFSSTAQERYSKWLMNQKPQSPQLNP